MKNVFCRYTYCVHFINEILKYIYYNTRYLLLKVILKCIIFLKNVRSIRVGVKINSIGIEYKSKQFIQIINFDNLT